MTVEDLVKYFMEASISGASKTQVRRKFKELYNLNDAQIDKLQKLSKFIKEKILKKTGLLMQLKI